MDYFYLLFYDVLSVSLSSAFNYCRNFVDYNQNVTSGKYD